MKTKPTSGGGGSTQTTATVSVGISAEGMLHMVKEKENMVENIVSDLEIQTATMEKVIQHVPTAIDVAYAIVRGDASIKKPRTSIRPCPVWGFVYFVSDWDKAKVMAILVISVSLDSSEDNVGTPDGRVILFAPTLPPSPDYTPGSLDYSSASDSESDPSEDPSSDHIPPLLAISPFLSSDDDLTDSDTPDTPSSPTHDTPFTEITASTQRSPIIPRCRVMLLAPGHPIPHGQPYRYHLNGPVHMMTARKRVGPLPTHYLAVRHPADHSSLDSSSEASSDFHSDASSDSSLRHLLSDHCGAISQETDSGYLADVEVHPRKTSLRDDVIVRGSDEPHLEQDIDLEIQAEIEKCFAYTDALRDKGIDVRVVVEAVDREE
ncbi:hypothetical protein Tco_0459854, partial [Tanacetum coccineum]